MTPPTQKQKARAAGLTEQGVRCLLNGDPNGAAALLRRAVHQSPNDKHALNNLGAALFAQGKTAEAVLFYEKAIRLDAHFAEAHCNLGQALAGSGDFERGLSHFVQGLEQKPDYAEGWNNLGLVYRDHGDLDEAVNAFMYALKLRPKFPEAYNNLGAVLREKGAFAQATTCYERAIALAPEYAAAHHNLGSVLTETLDYKNAEEHFRRALRSDPDFTDAVVKLANLLSDTGRPADAEAVLRPAMESDSTNVETVYAWATLQLRAGNFKEGFAAYECRFQKKDYPTRRLNTPRWDGSEAPGKTLLVSTEQGFGDTFQFARFLSESAKRVGTTVLECEEALIPLLSRCAGIDKLVPRGGPLPRADVHASLMSLPHLLDIRLDTIPNAVPYLFADPDLVETQRVLLEGSPNFRIGFCNRGRPRPSRFIDHRNIPAHHFADLMTLPVTAWFSLGTPADPELEALAEPIWPPDRDKTHGAFMDTAALMVHLDLVITSDTAIAHLAGALGLPVWVALPFNAEWRWLHRREDSPFYPTMRLFRQTRPGDFTELFARLKSALTSWIATPPPQRQTEAAKPTG